LDQFHIPKEKVVLFTGSEIQNNDKREEGNMKEKRKKEWKSKRIFFMTPQILENDLDDATLEKDVWKEIIFICFDECHHALKDYSYCKIVKKLYQMNLQHIRILGMTATPGKDFFQMNEIVSNLKISKIETRSEKNESIETKVIPVDLPIEFVKMKNLISKLLRVSLNQLYRDKLIMSTNPDEIVLDTLLKLVKKYHNDPSKNGIIGVSISLFHIYESFLIFGVKDFELKIKDFTDKATSSNPKKIFLNKIEWKEMIEYSKVITNEIHPKYKILETLIENHLNENKESKIIVFTSYRESITNISNYLKMNSKIKLITLIGQKSSTSSKGQNQKKQMENLKNFNDKNTINTLITTCVGEEGLDIKNVDLIICFDSSIPITRIIQRMGRTGRNNRGGCIFLATKQSNEESKIKHNLERKDDMFENLKNYHFKYSSSNRLIPREVEQTVNEITLTSEFWDPEVVDDEIEIVEHEMNHPAVDPILPVTATTVDSVEIFEDDSFDDFEPISPHRNEEEDKIENNDHEIKPLDDIFGKIFDSNFQFEKRNIESIYVTDSYGNNSMLYYSIEKKQKTMNQSPFSSKQSMSMSHESGIEDSKENESNNSSFIEKENSCAFGCVDKMGIPLYFETKFLADQHLEKFHFGDNSSQEETTFKTPDLSPIPMEKKQGFIDNEAE
jgi:ERCC4-related helicase